MARNIGADGSTVYRAAITIKDKTTGDTHTDYEGPYATAAAAQGRVTFWTNHLAELHPDTFKPTGTSRAEGHVEQAHTAWTPVGEAVNPLAIAPEFIAEHTRRVRAQAYRDAADEMETCQAAADAEERDRHGFLDHESELQGAAVRDMAAHLRRRAAEIHPAPEEQQQ
ncbi:hypothetical protein ABZ368_19275 [Streptomyces sp. NPDC005908]|uniref:hypothetical protein n=1 Tax=Streptomyces sp. NPDC005908 TaxID=3157084 RepID=UPI0033CBDA4A